MSIWVSTIAKGLTGIYRVEGRVSRAPAFWTANPLTLGVREVFLGSFSGI